jgi:hypothetical protein
MRRFNLCDFTLIDWDGGGLVRRSILMVILFPSVVYSRTK